jgi:outer membrane protein assembly factor BamD
VYPRVPLRQSLLLLALAAGTLVLSGCKSRGDEMEARGTPEAIFNQAVRDIAGGNYPEGIRKLEALESRYPFSEPARQAQLDLMYAYYKNRDAESAIDQADQFIRENPTHPRVDYAYYIRGLVYFEGGANWLERVFKADMAKRPPQEARQSFQSFQALVQGYPKSPYAADARQRMVYLRNRLADYELAVAEYYMKRGAYVGALNRARGLIETYDGAPAVPGALAIAAEAYRRLGMEDLALVADNVRLGNENLPDLVNPAAGTAGVAMAGQPGGDAEAYEGSGPVSMGRPWEARAALVMANSADLDFEGGSTAAVDGGAGLLLGVGYSFTDRLRVGSTFTYDQKDYTARIVEDGGTDESARTEEGSIDTMSLMVDAAYSFLMGDYTPYVTGGVGWSRVDTNIATEPPEVGCWWHPWWGYICTAWQDTRKVDGLAYELGIGLRYDFSEVLAADGNYIMRWVDFEHASGTPSFDAFRLGIVWRF